MVGALFDGYTAAVDWPASSLWRELSQAYPAALVLLSVRDTPEVWLRSVDEMILGHARRAAAAGWPAGRGLLKLLERFAGNADWDDPATLKAAYTRYSAEVRRTIPPQRLLEWQANQGWEPICAALGVGRARATVPAHRRSQRERAVIIRGRVGRHPCDCRPRQNTT